jgi:hypothetical protein
MSYDLSARELKVRFANGKTYLYDGVPPTVVDQIQDADSTGSAFAKLVKKGGYSYSEL